MGTKVASVIDIPFCVAGGIKSIKDAEMIFAFGADKISVNSPALTDPDLICRLTDRFGVQAVVVGIDSWYDEQSGKYWVKQFTGDTKKLVKPVGRPLTGFNKCKNWVQARLC